MDESPTSICSIENSSNVPCIIYTCMVSREQEDEFEILNLITLYQIHYPSPRPGSRVLPPNNNDLHFSEEFSSISDFDQKMGRRKNQRCVFVSHLHHRSGRGATCVVAVLLADELGPQSRI